ncbi:multipass membrane protein [Candidatus Mancarchaeum acidiphilum]|uniref:Multipass membrane protein n=1 Tax=Candidatus Mancarchaeum acidiphilum TaxID=1920749 RepID=A0A218NNW0_9ARCH|nr:hypothetical protein [Candidatus Mancarchaeum acidiphilum]ASI14167.1 multipass membrane protein [Candidatus Mancarchaeum acidiphilum]
MNYDATRRNRMGTPSRLGVNLILLEFFLLIIQFVIGMWMNLFAVFPSFGQSFFMYGMMQVMFSVPELMVHMMLGIFIGLVSLMIFFVFAMAGDYRLSALSAVASISILTAGIGGLEFMFSGFTNNIFSFLMSLGFIFTIVAYASILYMISSSDRRTGTP